MSHSKNVDGFARIVDIYTRFGGIQTPGQRNLQAENLYLLLTRARHALTQVNEARTSFENVNDDRKKVFTEINRLASRITSELRSSGVTPDTIAAATAMVRKIRGQGSPANRASVPSGQVTANAATAPVKSSRTQGRDYGSVVYHFEKLLQTLASEPLYQPETPDLQMANLQTKLSALQNGNAAVSAALAELGKARRNRNAVLYGGPESLYGAAMAVKNKVKAVFGASSESAHAVTHITLTKTKSR